MKPSILKKCAHCGTEFTTTNQRRIYCSKRCNDREYYDRHYKYHAHAKKVCLFCGKEYTPNSSHQKYCNADCAKQAGHQKIKDWHSEHADLVRIRNRAYNRDYRARRGTRYVRKPLQEIVCKECGQVFMQTYPLQKYCSEKCGRTYHHRAEKQRKQNYDLTLPETITQEKIDAYLKMLFG